MSFIPGKKCREYFHDAEGRIFFDRKTAASYAEKFIFPLGVEYAVLCQQVAYCLGDGDEINIWFGLRGLREGEEEFPDGELPGRTYATITRAGTDRADTFFEVERSTRPTPQSDATRAFNVYRSALAAFQEEVAEPTPLPIPTERDDNSDTSSRPKPVSRAFSPTNLYHNSGVMWYFVDIGSIMPYSSPEMTLLRPMEAVDALILSALLTVSIGWPPGVYAVYQPMPLGRMPSSFRKEVSVDAVEPPLEGDEIAIVC